MKEFILFMHTDNDENSEGADWPAYFAKIRATGRFDGGSEIGDGATFRKVDVPHPVATQLGGFIRVRAQSLEDAKQFLEGNPVYETGGTIEIRELPES